ncbi:MAG: GNAT family N-acetyltransferase [Thermoleophilia bacterium]
MSGVVVRKAVAADAVGIARVHVRAWQVAYAGLLPAEALTGLGVEESATRWSELLTWPRPGTIVLVAERDDRVVGFASIGPSRDADADPAVVGELFALYVSPAAWRTGVGRALLSAADTMLAVAGFERATLWVLVDNARARGVYEAAGWLPEGATKVEAHLGRNLRELRYVRDLGGREAPEEAGEPID